MNKLRVVLIICLFSISFSSFSNGKINFLVSCRDFVHENDEDNRCNGYSFRTNEYFFHPTEMTLKLEKSPYPVYVAKASVMPTKSGIPGLAEEGHHLDYCGIMFIKNATDSRTTMGCIVKNARGIHWENKTPTPDITIQMKFDMDRNGHIDSSCECVGPEPA